MAHWRRRLSPVLTPLFRGYWRVSRGMTLGATVVAQDSENRIMLVKTSYRPGWELPGGGVEPLETVEDAARRELAEEAGLAAEGPMQLLGVYANHANFKNDHVVLFHTKTFRPCPPAQSQEIEARGFFALDALPTPLGRPARERLNEMFMGAPRSPFW